METSVNVHVPSVVSKIRDDHNSMIGVREREKENNQPLKKSKTNQFEDEESLGSEEEDDLDDDENAQDDDEGNLNQITLHANDVIELTFDGIGAVPTYTHQLFEDEKLVFPCDEINTYTHESLADFMIKVDISLVND